MTMEKYGVSRAEVLRLIELGVCSTETEALEKVASGKAEGLIKEAEKKTTKEEDHARRSK